MSETPDAEKDAPWRADDHPPHSWPIGSVAGWRDGHGCPTTWCKGEGSRRDETFNTRPTSPDKDVPCTCGAQVTRPYPNDTGHHSTTECIDEATGRVLPPAETREARP